MPKIALRSWQRFTWFLEVAPVLIALPLLVLTYPRFAFSRLAYGLMLIRAIILMIGGHYTYAEMPLSNLSLKSGKWLFLLVTCVCLAISARYKFLEWWVVQKWLRC